MPLTTDNMTEAEITIEGVRLSFGQSMALRVAASNFLTTLSHDPEALGSDEHGRHMAKNYRERLSEILKLMVGDRKR